MSAAAGGASAPGRGPAARLRAFGAFWYEFVIGDDWVVAAGVVAGLAGTWGLHAAGVTAWWLLPIVLVVLLPVSLARAVGGRIFARPAGTTGTGGTARSGPSGPPLLPRRRGRHRPPASPRTPPAS